MKPYCVFVCRVKRVIESTSRSGKPYVILTVEGLPTHYGDKQYRSRATVFVYRDWETARNLAVGTLISVRGEADAKTNEYQGKTYANLTITGEVEVIDEGKAPAPTQQEFKQERKPATASAPSTPDPDDDDVPF